MRALLFVAACFLVIGLGVRADDPPVKKPDDPTTKPMEKKGPKPLDRLELDARAAKIAHDAAKLGSELWDDKKYEGTFRLYQGTLMALEPILDHRPILMTYVRVRMEKAQEMKAEDGAFVLREALDAIQKETAAAAASIPPKPALWLRMGGEKVVKAVVHDFVTEMIKDPKVNFTRKGEFKLSPKQVTLLEEHFVELMSEVAHGPIPYGGREIPKLHAGMKITSDEFNAFVAQFTAALKKNKVSEDETEELLKGLRSLKPFFVDK